jgi:hypothetical protein
MPGEQFRAARIDPSRCGENRHHQSGGLATTEPGQQKLLLDTNRVTH